MGATVIVGMKSLLLANTISRSDAEGLHHLTLVFCKMLITEPA